MTVTSVYPFSAHVHLGGGVLLNHSGCCSTPYQFDMGGASFSVVSVDIVSMSVAGSFTSSAGTVTPSGTGTLAFPASWTNITSFQWNQPSGSMNIDNLCIQVNTPPVAVCQAAVVAVGEVPDVDGGSYDPDAGDTITLSQSPSGAFTAAGIYDVVLTVTDSHGASDSCTAMVVVYDPSAGFVTGGGWIDSPAGAYKPNSGLTGKANFGFVSKYKKGANTPTGNTEFQFKAGDLNFHSSSYEWLVVTGSDYAKFKGTGTINGSGEFKFQIWAGDDSPDTFQIKIWTEDQAGAETIVYDNGYDQAIGGGSIKIHTN
ncbi:MAG: hypothetical protein ACYTBS_13210 [Planctomycetota bacterium]